VDTPFELHIALRYLLAKRKQAWKKPTPRYTRGVLAKYAAHVTSASEGAVTDAEKKREEKSWMMMHSIFEFSPLLSFILFIYKKIILKLL